ncbi:MAG: GTPase ObgE [Limnochordia bacterium]
MFVDQAVIRAKAGDGGDGVVSFRREKFVPAGGPDGGNGGRGGDVVLLADEGLRTLVEFRYQSHFKAENGARGGGSRKQGKTGADRIIKVPVGTVIKVDGEVVGDLTRHGQTMVVARGGRGGQGNASFAGPTRQAPAFAQKGEAGEESVLELELKLLADVGLIGYPNVGKSSLIARISAARPKIASYPFTTITPNLGVVVLDDHTSFVVADIPGLIEGAHRGVGLGHSFLRHVERTRVLIHVLDAAALEGRDPIADFHKINEELRLYDPKLADRPQLVAANKIDLPQSEDYLSRTIQSLTELGYEVYPISAATGKGVDRLIGRAAAVLDEITRLEKDSAAEEENQYVIYRPSRPSSLRDFSISKEGDVFVVEGEGFEGWLARLDLNNYETLMYIQRTLQRVGVSDALREAGVQDGDTVKVGDLEFEFVE